MHPNAHLPPPILAYLHSGEGCHSAP
jgi:hypothetical protein